MTPTTSRIALLPLLLASACAGQTTATDDTTTAPEAPSMLTADLAGRGAHLTWMDNSNNEAVFIVERKTMGGTYGEVTRVAADTMQYHDAPLDEGTYVYRVSANNRVGRSAVSNEATVTVPPITSASSSSSGGNSTSTSASTASSGTAATSTMTTGSSTSVMGSSSGPQVVRPNFEDDIVPIIQASYGTGTNGCHSRESYYATANRNCRGWLSLEDAALGATGYDPATMGQATGCQDRDLYYRITAINAWQCDVPYISPGNPNGSYIWRKVAGGPYCDASPGVPSEPMPSVGPPLSMQDLNTLRTWIENGAPRR